MIIKPVEQGEKTNPPQVTDTPSQKETQTNNWFMVSITKHDTKGKIISHTVRFITGSNKDSVYNEY